MPLVENPSEVRATLETDPDFFSPSLVANGIFYGVQDGPDLIAAAGTHLAEPTEGIGCVGNVYTRRDRGGAALPPRSRRPWPRSWSAWAFAWSPCMSTSETPV